MKLLGFLMNAKRQNGSFLRVLLAGLVYCVAAADALPAQTFQYFNTVLTFNGTNGSIPDGLIQATNGNLYGTTQFGGANNDGTVFQITPSVQFTTLYNFCSLPSCADGRAPYGGVVQGPDGNLYGTTNNGGVTGISGTVFQLTLEGTLTTLYNFCSQARCADGQFPQAGITIGADGNYYGTTNLGGAYSFGTLFQLTTAGALNVLYSFTGGGQDPTRLVRSWKTPWGTSGARQLLMAQHISSTRQRGQWWRISVLPILLTCLLASRTLSRWGLTETCTSPPSLVGGEIPAVGVLEARKISVAAKSLASLHRPAISSGSTVFLVRTPSAPMGQIHSAG